MFISVLLWFFCFLFLSYIVIEFVEILYVVCVHDHTACLRKILSLLITVMETALFKTSLKIQGKKKICKWISYVH